MIIIYIIGLYSLTPLSRGVHEEYWSSVFRPDALPDVNHMLIKLQCMNVRLWLPFILYLWTGDYRYFSVVECVL